MAEITKIHGTCGSGFEDKIHPGVCGCETPLTETQVERAGGIRWRLSYIDPNTKKTVRKRFRSKTAAKAFETDASKEIKDGAYVTPSSFTLAELRADHLKRTLYAEATLANQNVAWGYVVAAELDAKPITKVTPADIEALTGPLPPAMAEKVRLVISTLFNAELSSQRPRVGSNPARKVRKDTTRAAKKASSRKRDIRVLSEPELAGLVAEVPERWRAMVELMAYEGLRPGEVVALTIGKLDVMAGTLLVDTARSGDTKTGESRTLLLTRTVVDDILVPHLRDTYGTSPWDPAAPIFPRENGTAIKTKDEYDAWARRVFGGAAKRADANHGLSPNDLRHHAAAFAIGKGADVYSVQRMLGHSKPSITLDIYGYLWDKTAQEARETRDKAIREARAMPAIATDVVGSEPKVDGNIDGTARESGSQGFSRGTTSIL